MKAAKQLATRKANAALLAERLLGRLGPRSRPPLPAVDFEIDLSAAAAAMLMSEEEWLEQLGDGRKASGPAESWSAQCVGGKTCPNKNEKGYDVDHRRLGRISVKCLTKSKVCFEMSVDVGAGRGGVALTAEEQALPDAERSAVVKLKKRERSMRSIAQAAWHAVVDIRHAPRMRVTLVPGAWLLAHTEAGTLDSTGWSGERFYALVAESYELRPMSLGRRLPNEAERLEITETLMSDQTQPAGPIISKADRLALLKSERAALRLEQKEAQKSERKARSKAPVVALIPEAQALPAQTPEAMANELALDASAHAQTPEQMASELAQELSNRGAQGAGSGRAR